MAPQYPNVPERGSSLSTPVGMLAGVGKARAGQLQQLGVNTLGDLLEYFPRRYQVEKSERPISELVSGQIQFARGEVIAVNYIPYPRKRFEATIQDPTGTLSLTWFNGAYLRDKIHPGQILRVQGKAGLFRNQPQIVQPRWQIIAPDAPLVGDDILRAIYPASTQLSSMQIWKIIEANLPSALDDVQEWFTPELLAQRSLLPRKQAFAVIHQPPTQEDARAARRRLVYDELMLMQLGLLVGKRLRQADVRAPAMRLDRLLDERIRKRFPFQLTEAQTQAVWEIVRDMQCDVPMNRLLQGDVGSGKTVVALYAMLVAIANKQQALLLAPTQILAEQHYLTISQMLAGSGVKIELLTHEAKKKGGELLRERLSRGEVHIAIGTQAILSEDVNLPDVGVVVVDEQHKLGVRQRGILREKGLSPHYLVMTATPIPRTLALSYFADFAITTIAQLPPGRQPIRTQWFRQSEAPLAYARLKNEVAAGRQAYVVVPKVEQGTEGDDPDLKNVQDHLEKLRAGELHGLRLEMLHGQMSSEDKGRTMLAFRDGKIDVLVATTVVEVGVDVPNATVMLIENAGQFGLSQLHQLRGRVGRGPHRSHCLLVGEALTEDAGQRLDALVKTSSGFDIAETDLRLRGPGEFFGVRQHGLPEFKLADIAGELEMLHLTREDAKRLLDADPQLRRPEHAAIRLELLRQFGDALELVQIG